MLVCFFEVLDGLFHALLALLERKDFFVFLNGEFFEDADLFAKLLRLC